MSTLNVKAWPIVDRRIRLDDYRFMTAHVILTNYGSLKNNNAIQLSKSATA